MAVEEGWADRLPELDLPSQCPYDCQSESMNTENPHATHLGPRGAQYSPVFCMSNVLMNSMSDSAASSGVTAIVRGEPRGRARPDRSFLPPPSSQNLSNPTPFVISVLMNPGCCEYQHHSPGETGTLLDPNMHNPNGDPLVLEIQTQELSHHVQSAFTRMVSIIASSLALMPQLYAPTL